MDPFSIAVTCTALVSTITKLTTTLTSFSRRVRESRHDITVIVQELVSLITTLEYLAEDMSDPENCKKLPPSLVSQMKGLLAGCDKVVMQISQSISKFDSDGLIVRTQWAITGHEDMEKLRSSLEAHKSALAIGLDMLLLTIAKDIKYDTEQIREDTSAIRGDTAEIIALIRRLEQLQLKGAEPNDQFMLQRYLEELTTYAETAYQESLVDLEENVQQGLRSAGENPSPRNGRGSPVGQFSRRGIVENTQAETQQLETSETETATSREYLGPVKGQADELLSMSGRIGGLDDKDPSRPYNDAAAQNEKKNTRRYIGKTPSIELRLILADTDVSIVRKLLADGADPNYKYDYVPQDYRLASYGETKRGLARLFAIQNAALYGNSACLQVLLESGADPNKYTLATPTALMLATEMGHLDCVRQLLSYRADPNNRQHDDPSQPTALHIAIKTEQFDVVELLLQSKADANAVLQDKVPLFHAAIIPYPASIAMCNSLLAHGAEINPADEMLLNSLIKTLSPVSDKEKLAVIEWFAANGANPNCYAGPSALSTAIDFSANPEIVNILVSHGADVNAPRMRRHGEVLPLMEAVENGSFELIEKLLEHGADPIKPCVQRWFYAANTALEVAVEKLNTEILTFLLSAPQLVNKAQHITHGRLLHLAICRITGISGDTSRISTMLQYLVQIGANTGRMKVGYTQQSWTGRGWVEKTCTVKALAADVAFPKGLKRKEFFRDVGLEV